MKDEILAFNEFETNELSEEDLAVIQAFEAMEVWPVGLSSCQTNDQDKMLEVSQACPLREDSEMLLLFVTEAEADLSSIRQTLDQLTEDEAGNLTLFITLKRAGHKLHGTAGAVGFPLISAVAGQVELIAEGVSRSAISAHVGVEAISAATRVLEACLQAITSVSEELEAPALLTSLGAVYQCLHIDLQELEPDFAVPGKIDARAKKSLPSTSPLRIDVQHFEQLAGYAEQLVVSTVEDARRSVFCFLVRAGDQRLLIPFQQIQRISNGQQEQINVCYSLQELLSFPSEASPQPIVKPRGSTSQHLLILCSEGETLGERTAGIVVDEVLDERECMVEPLSAYLQRPGIVGTTIDSEGDIVLVVDLLGLLRFRQ